MNYDGSDGPIRLAIGLALLAAPVVLAGVAVFLAFKVLT